MNFTYFLTPDEVKANGMLNANVDTEYIEPSLQEAQDVYLREIIGDALYTAIENRINNNNLTDQYNTLVEQYIKPYLGYKLLSLIVFPINFKMRNMGVVTQYGEGVTTATMKDVAYLADYYNNRVEFYENRMTEYLKKNTADFPEYGYSSENITNPSQTHTAGTIYLGGGRKRSCGLKTGSGGGSTDKVEWNDIQNKPDFAEVATSGSYNDLDNKPEIPSLEGYATEEWVQEQGYSTFDGDYNNLTNKPTIPTVPTNVSAFANDAGYLTQHQSLDGYATEQWVSEQGFSTFSGSYEDLTDKPSIPTVNDALLTIKQGGVTKGTFSANSNQNIEINLESGGSGGSTDWNDITNKPDFATVATSGSYTDLNDKPTIPTKTSELTNDSGYSTFSGSYNDLRDIPNYFSYIQENGSHNGVILNGETQFGEITADIAAGIQCNFKVDKAQSTKLYTDYIITGENTSGRNELVVSGNDGNNVYGKIAKDGIYEGNSKLSDKYLQIANLPTNVSAFTNDAGYTTFDGDYNSLTNKPTIPSAQIQSDWNANSGMGQILNKPSMTAETWTFSVDNGQGGTTTVTKKVWLEQ